MKDRKLLFSLNHSLVLTISLICLISIGSLAYIQYYEAQNTLINNFNSEVEKTSVIVNHSVRILFDALSLYDRQYDYEMQESLQIFNNAYELSGRDPSHINLGNVKNRIISSYPGQVELYIINSSGYIEHSTDPEEINHNLGIYPGFLLQLEDIRSGNKFVSDRWIERIENPGVFRKYGYLPTRDKRYILEIGIDSDEYWQARREAFSYEKLGSVLMNMSEGLSGVTFFTRTLEAIDNEPGRLLITSNVSKFIPPEDLRRDLLSVFSKRQSIIREYDNQIINYIYLEEGDVYAASSNTRLVAVLVYPTDKLTAQLHDYLLLLMTITAIGFLIALIFAFYLSRHIAAPIVQIIEDVDAIAKGDYLHPIRETGGTDLMHLRSSIRIMVDRILASTREIQKNQIQLAEELKARQATEKALLIANEKLNNLGSITRHDIMNQVTCIRGYAYLSEIADSLEEVHAYGKEINRISHVIEDIIAFSRDYHNLGVNGPVWNNVESLVYNSIMVPFRDKVTLTIHASDLEILADPLFQRVFFNLADNSLKHGGEGANKITISFYEMDNCGVLLYSDEGTGVSPEEKEVIFHKGFGKGTGLGLFLIREILAITGITIQETGEYAKGARFELHIPKSQYRFVSTHTEGQDEK